MIARSLGTESGNAFVALAQRARLTRAPVLVACEVIGFTAALAMYALMHEHASIAFPVLSIGAFG